MKLTNFYAKNRGYTSHDGYPPAQSKSKITTIH